MSNAIRWTQEMLEDFNRRREGGRRATDPPAPGKFLNEKVRDGAITHDSKKEARRWAQLEMSQRAGFISQLRRQVSYELAPAVRLLGERRKKPALRYVADFTYMRDGQLVIEDAKSDHTRTLDVYRIKKHLMKTVLNLDITEV